MTSTKLTVRRVLTGIINYFKFAWGIGWRTLLLSLITAVFSGVAIGVISGINGWPPAMTEQMASYIGLPITLMVFTYIFCRQLYRVAR